MMKTALKIFLFLLSFFPFALFSQVNETLVNTSSLSINDNSYSFDIAIGETIGTSIYSSKEIVSQGFLQPIIKQFNAIGSIKNENNIIVFPNPFSEKITIESDIKNFHSKLIDLAGRIVYTSNESILQPSSLCSGYYTLMIFNENNIPLATFKICKIE